MQARLTRPKRSEADGYERIECLDVLSAGPLNDLLQSYIDAPLPSRMRSAPPTANHRRTATPAAARPTAQQSAAVASKVEARAQRLAAAMRGEQADYEHQLAETWELCGEDATVFAAVARAAVRLAPEYSKVAGDAVGALTAHARAAFAKREKEFARLA
jgi:hypothetical protein